MGSRTYLRPTVDILRSGPNGFLLHDRRTGNCITIDSDERLLLHLLMSSQSPENVCQAFTARLGQEITPAQVEAFVRQLREHDLLSADQDQSVQLDLPKVSETPPALISPLSFSNRGAKLNLFFDILVLLFGWAIHPLWIAPLFLLVLAAINVFVRDGWQLVADIHGFIDSYPLLLYVVFYILPKLFLLSLLQASLSGVVCRSCGGRVDRMWVHFHGGVIPLIRTRLDGSVLAQLNRQGRLTLLSIGLWLPVVLASFSALAWAATSPNSGLRILFALLIPPCLIRIAINCNIFFKFSGLYLLFCEVIGERRLLRVAKAETIAWLLCRPSPSVMAPLKRVWLRFYGVGYFAYRFVVVLLLGIAGGYLVMTYAESQDLPPWSVEYALVVIALVCSRNADSHRVTHERRFLWRPQPVV